MSSETANLLLATLSAGSVGVGDPVGSVDIATLLHAVRKDGVIVKPDVPAVPTDQTLINDARGLQAPMVAATYTDFDGLRAAYVMAYRRGSDLAVSFEPGSLVNGRAFVYNYFAHAGTIVDSSDVFTESVADDYTYYIVTPIGESGIGLLGDTAHFVSLGKQRITSVVDNGVLEVAIAFAPGEGARTIQGYSPLQPAVTAVKGAAQVRAYDPSAHLFSINVTDAGDGSAAFRLTAKGADPDATGGR